MMLRSLASGETGTGKNPPTKLDEGRVSARCQREIAGRTCRRGLETSLRMKLRGETATRARERALGVFVGVIYKSRLSRN